VYALGFRPVKIRAMNKQQLAKVIKEELPGTTSYFDILSVVNILLDELKQEILTTKQTSIPNFGKFTLKTFKPKVIKNVRTGKMQLTKAYTALRFAISRNILKQLMKTGAS
jgi:nucleoid DNA-binding protein